MIQVFKTLPGDQLFAEFENFLYDNYDCHPSKIAIKNSINKEYLYACYIVKNNAKIVARASLYINPFLKFNEKKTACIGNYECINNYSVAKYLLDNLLKESNQKGCNYCIGPMNGSTWDEYRFTLSNESPFFLEPFNHTYYIQHFLDSGFHTIADYASYQQTNLNFEIKNIESIKTNLLEKGILFRNIDLTNYEGELEKIYSLNTVAFQKNFLYTPIAKENFITKYKTIKPFINPEYVIIAEDNNKQIQGFVFCIPDLLEKRQNRLILKTLVRKPGNIYRGLGNLLVYLVINHAKNTGYSSIIHALIHETNFSKQLSNDYAGEAFKNYVLMGRET